MSNIINLKLICGYHFRKHRDEFIQFDAASVKSKTTKPIESCPRLPPTSPSTPSPASGAASGPVTMTRPPSPRPRRPSKKVLTITDHFKYFFTDFRIFIQLSSHFVHIL